jgi:phenylpropionate dioxygenase-like ring-hydroxylating dioxygenase large terminal subunit
MTFVDNPAMRDAWYVVAEFDDVAPGPLAARLLGQNLVLWRDDDDQIVAAPDRCPHREAPLSIGQVNSGVLTCAYHGWEFGCAGRCVGVPSSGPEATIPPAAHLDTYAVEVRYGLIWVCPGTPPGGIPTVTHEADPAFRRINSGVDVWKTSAMRMTDNFLDISHFSWVHAGTFGAGLDPLVLPISLEQLDEDFYGYAYEVDAANPDDAVATTGSEEPTVHRWMSTGFHLPFVVRSTVRYEDGLEHIILLSSTPIDDVTSYFTFVIWRNDDHSTDPEETIAFDRAIGAEDKVMLEQVPGVMSMGRTDLASVQSDKPSVEWRRRFTAMLD